MKEIDKQELRRLAEQSKQANDLRSKVGYWTLPVDPAAILSLLDELEENDGVIAVWRGRTQRAEAELEQYRKDAERYRWLKEQWHGFQHYRDSTGTVENVDREIDEAIAVCNWKPMAKEGGANG